MVQLEEIQKGKSIQVQVRANTLEDEVKESMDKKDGLYIIGYYVYSMIVLWLFGLLLFKTHLSPNLGRYFNNKDFFRFLFFMPFVMIQVLPVFVILYVKKQSIRSIGIKKNKIGKSILIGIAGSIPFSILNILSQISSGKTLNLNLKMDLLWTFLYYLICIAFAEEVIFRGFFQTRVQGLMKNKWASIILVGIMFGFMHVPFQMINADMSLVEFIMYDFGHLINTSLLHMYFVYLYSRDNNIIAPVVAHAIINFSFEMFW